MSYNVPRVNSSPPPFIEELDTSTKKEYLRKVTLVVCIIIIALLASTTPNTDWGSKTFYAEVAITGASALTLLVLWHLNYDQFAYFEKYKDGRHSVERELKGTIHYIADTNGFYRDCEARFKALNLGEAQLPTLDALRAHGNDPYAFGQVVSQPEVITAYIGARMAALDNYLTSLGIANPSTYYPYLMQGAMGDFLMRPLMRHFPNSEVLIFKQQSAASACNSSYRIFRNSQNEICVEYLQKFEMYNKDTDLAEYYIVGISVVNITKKSVSIGWQKMDKPPNHIDSYTSIK